MSGSFDVFLSHNSEDKPAVRQLAQALQAQGLGVWLDEEQLVPGRLWQDALQEIIQTTRTAAVLVGKNGLGPWEKPEMRACLSEFVDHHLPVIPVLLPGAPAELELPLFLRAFTWVDLRGGLTEDGLNRLVWGITGSKEQRQMKKGELIKLANEHELSKSYEEAIKKWRMVHDLDPEDPNVAKQIERLEGKLQSKDRLENYIGKLVLRISEIKSVFGEVIDCLRKMEQAGKDNENILLIVEEFLQRQISAENFMMAWEVLSEQEPTKTPAEQQPNYPALADRLNRGEVILFLGSDIPQLSGITELDLEKLVEGLAIKTNYTDFTGTLSMIAQYYEMSDYGRSSLVRNLNDLIEKKNIPEIKLYRLLARVEQPLVLISATYDMFLENCFRAAKKKYALISSVICSRNNYRIGESNHNLGVGNVIVHYSDQQEGRVLQLGQDLSKEDLNDYSLIYKIRGYFDNLKPGVWQDTLTLTEENYFDFARNIGDSIPSYIIDQFTGRIVCFVGYSTKHWEDRLLVSLILNLPKLKTVKKMVITETEDHFERTYWHWKDVDIYSVSLENFVAQLEAQLEIYLK